MQAGPDEKIHQANKIATLVRELAASGIESGHILKAA